MRGAAYLIVLALATPLPAQPVPQPPLPTFRQSHGLSLPAWSSELADSALRRAQTLAETGVLSHEDPLGRGPGLQALAEGLPPGEYGEVLGAGRDFDAVWAGWLGSPPHRDVLSSPGWTRWGLGSAPLGATRVWVLRFWKP